MKTEFETDELELPADSPPPLEENKGSDLTSSMAEAEILMEKSPAVLFVFDVEAPLLMQTGDFAQGGARRSPPDFCGGLESAFKTGMDSGVVLLFGDKLKSPFSAFLTFFRGGLGSSKDGNTKLALAAEWLAID